MAARCPECGSTRIETFLMPYGPMWCMDCGFGVEDKMAPSNPFLETEEGDEDSGDRDPDASQTDD
jgi:transcription initiation factor TFIIIB Brf1 subunit/transcription initiation factor TFIIB